MPADFIHLAWDSDFFGIKVARIALGNVCEDRLTSVLNELRANDYHLAYWNLPLENSVGAQLAVSKGGFMADEKITYTKQLTGRREEKTWPSIPISRYEGIEPNEVLINLALESGMHSRFRCDPNFPRNLFEKLYSCWIKRAVSGEIGSHVLIAGAGEKITGVITLGSEAQSGVIGLLAVSHAVRGGGIGKSLIEEAENIFFHQKLKTSQVVTQRSNIPACRFYEACGYQVQKIERVFHFWLQQDANTV